MTADQKSCAVAVPIQRNCATQSDAATQNATGSAMTKPKAASIRELRAQLKAQQVRNQAETAPTTVAEKIARDSSPSCAVALPSERNRATLIPSGPFTPWSPPVSPELVTELHRLIEQYAKQFRLADAAASRIIEAAKRQAAAKVPESISFFKNQLAALAGDQQQRNRS
ncbi:hypothetical protein EGT07_10215 [Herbaspirillum sp. HC18]|nr:hypothetical protein EGT07_10215 [Herbaspirillum sp. HC18]